MEFHCVLRREQKKQSMSRIYFIVGILCFLIPVSLQILDDRQQEGLISTYEKVIAEQGTEEQEQCYENALSYNQTQGSDYENQLNLAGTGMMGNLEIPKINLKLPIYHGTSDDVLANGIGHMKETSLPVGGNDCHAVLTGHCGLPNAELFTRLDELVQGDRFYVRVCGNVLGYEVIRVLIVDPEDASAIEAEAGKDLISLVTCTPYGINTHRLIVTGERMEDGDVEKFMLEESEGGVDEKIYYLVGISAVLLLCIVCRSISRKRGNTSLARTKN